MNGQRTAMSLDVTVQAIAHPMFKKTIYIIYNGYAIKVYNVLI